MLPDGSSLRSRPVRRAEKTVPAGVADGHRRTDGFTRTSPFLAAISLVRISPVPDGVIDASGSHFSAGTLRLQVDLDGAPHRWEGDDETHRGGDVVRGQQVPGPFLTGGGQQTCTGCDHAGTDEAHLDPMVPDVKEHLMCQPCEAVLAGGLRRVARVGAAAGP